MELVHSWYPTFCCSEKDCIDIPCESIIRQGDIYVYNGIKSLSGMIPALSPDNLCHICIGNMGAAGDFIRCLFIPLGVS